MKIKRYEDGNHLDDILEYESKKCQKCVEEDIDDRGFCRCEDRNIELAKFLRETERSAWYGLNKN